MGSVTPTQAKAGQVEGKQGFSAEEALGAIRVLLRTEEGRQVLAASGLSISAGSPGGAGANEQRAPGVEGSEPTRMPVSTAPAPLLQEQLQQQHQQQHDLLQAQEQQNKERLEQDEEDCVHRENMLQQQHLLYLQQQEQQRQAHLLQHQQEQARAGTAGGVVGEPPQPTAPTGMENVEEALREKSRSPRQTRAAGDRVTQ